MLNAAIDYFRQNTTFSQSETERIFSFFETETFRSEQPLFKEGDHYRKIVLIDSGVLRVFITSEKGDEIVKNFAAELDFVADMDCFFLNQPSKISVSAVTDCTVLTLSKPSCDRLALEIEQIDATIRALALQAVTKMITSQNFLRTGDSVDQYRYFVTHFPELARRVPLKYIASYLRITQSSLSRIRRMRW